MYIVAQGDSGFLSITRNQFATFRAWSGFGLIKCQIPVMYGNQMMSASLLLRPWPFVRLSEKTHSQHRAEADAIQRTQSYVQATGYRPHPSTTHRHRLAGCHGVRLETIKCGGKRMTSVEAVHRFNEAVTLAADGESPAPQARTPRQRERDGESAIHQLEQIGI